MYLVEKRNIFDLSIETKKKLWDWMFSFNWDELLVNENIVLGIDFIRMGRYWKQTENGWISDESR